MDEAIRAGLLSAQKKLSSSLLYDDLGSALFEAITLLPEYGVSRAGFRNLTANADAMVGAVPGPVDVVELGPGSGKKAKVLLQALAKRQAGVDFVGVDVSQAALDDTERTVLQVPGVSVEKVCARYLEGIAQAHRKPGHHRLVLFLGSNLSNSSRTEAAQFFVDTRAVMAPGDALLVGVDLDKDPALLVPAYDDALGVTAAFNRNLLVRMNRDYDADFDVKAFVHQARWNAQERRVESYLVSQRPQTVKVKKLGLELTFAKGESLWTESSHRFTVPELEGWGRAAQFTPTHHWVDSQWPFAHVLFMAE